MSMTKLECDGCGREIEIDLVDSPCNTVEECVTYAKQFPACCKDHMGWMKVGGPAWFDLHDKGIHPMESIISDVAKFLGRYKATN